MASNPTSKLTEEQYLALERAAEFRSEFVNGEMFAMAGGTMRHSQLQRNILSAVDQALLDSECQVFTSDFRVRVSADMSTYPDVTIVCGKPILLDGHRDTLLNPTVIFEVLSPSTEPYDRGLKFQRYRTVSSLKEYILVDQNKVRVEQYIRGESDTWVLRDYKELDDNLVLHSSGVTLPLRRIYRGVEFPPAQP